MVQDNEQQQVTESTEMKEPDYKALYEESQAEVAKWKAFSRKNESKAKANSDAATSLEQLQEQMSKLMEQMQGIQSENSALKAKEQRRELVAKVASETSLPESVIGALSGNDEETLTEQAQALKAAIPAYPSRTDDGGTGKPSTASNAQRFGEIISNAIKM